MANIITSGVFNLGALGGDGAGYEIDHSLQFDGSADYLTSSTLAASNRRTFTLSAWIKPSSIQTSSRAIFSGMYVATGHNKQIHLGLEGGNLSYFEFDGSNFISYLNTSTTPISAGTWYHVVFAIDTQQTSGKVKIWLDGTLQSLSLQGGASNYGINDETYMSAGTWPSTTVAQKFTLGAGYSFGNSTLYRQFHSQIAEVHFIDGQALTASDFGETVGGTWYPKAYTGTYGTNGFHLDFADNSTASALGTDVSGNGNNFSVTSIATTDQLTDVPSSAPTTKRPTRRWGGMTGRSLVESVPSTPAFKALAFTGNGASSRAITGVGFQPDFVWLKSRDNATSHQVVDVVRGATKALLTNSTNGEDDTQTDFSGGGVETIDTNGFTLGNGTINNSNFNGSGDDSIAWCLKAGGAVSANNNTVGSITSTVSANTAAGFSIVTYAGEHATGSTVGHGLSQAPELIISKSRDETKGWGVYYTVRGTNTNYMQLQDSLAEGTNNGPLAGGAWMVSNAETLELASGAFGNQTSMVAYCFHSVPGFSKIDSYSGSGGAGNKVTTGFRPAFVMIKSTGSGDWVMFDNARSATNPADEVLYANSNAVEPTPSTATSINFLADGFDFGGGGSSINSTGTHSYIYLAFAEGIPGADATPTTGVLSLAEQYQGKL